VKNQLIKVQVIYQQWIVQIRNMGSLWRINIINHKDDPQMKRDNHYMDNKQVWRW